jgi:hypothetical protein
MATFLLTLNSAFEQGAPVLGTIQAGNRVGALQVVADLLTAKGFSDVEIDTETLTEVYFYGFYDLDESVFDAGFIFKPERFNSDLCASGTQYLSITDAKEANFSL